MANPIIKCKCGRNTINGLSCIWCQELILEIERESPESEDPEFHEEFEALEAAAIEALNRLEEED